jgi:hypothetical protein
MAGEELRYDLMVRDALRGVVRRALDIVAERGLPGDHHIYITFRSDHAGVLMADHLRARHPGEMTIVLQHQFWGLEVGEDAFGITLSFSDVPERLTVPFEAVISFADPSVRFGLQFDAGLIQGLGELGQAVTSVTDLPSARPDAATRRRGTSARTTAADETAAEKAGATAKVQGAAGDDTGKVVTLETFRKK